MTNGKPLIAGGHRTFDHPPAFRPGDGARLEHAERWLADTGAVVIELDTLATSPDSVPFHEAVGYRPLPSSSNEDLNGEHLRAKSANPRVPRSSDDVGRRRFANIYPSEPLGHLANPSN